MKTTIALLLAATALSAPAFAQTKAPAPSATPTTTATTTAPMNATGEWRASKLVGVNVYNDQNESVGEIDEVLIDHSGKVAGLVIGVGGFLGVGKQEVLMPLDQVKFINEPVRSASTTTSTTNTAPRTGAATTGATANTAGSANTQSKSKWYPDHAVISATKDQLKAMPQFKYD